MADDGRRPGVPRHAALARLAARGARGTRTCPTRLVSPPTRATPSTRRCWPTRSVPLCSWCSTRWLRPSGSRSCCTTCSRFRSTRSAVILGRSPNAAKQLASRARRRLQGSAPPPTPTWPASERSWTPSSPPRAAATSRRCSPCSTRRSCSGPIAQPCRWARLQRCSEPRPWPASSSGRALEAQPALVGGRVGVVWAPGGAPKVAWNLTIAGDTIVLIEMIADAASLEELDLVVLGTTSRR